MMKIYAIAIGARKNYATHTKAFTRASATKNASSEEEAIGIGIKMAMEIFPPHQNYHGHYATVCEIPQKWFNVDNV